jgi:hypothetical protein
MNPKCRSKGKFKQRMVNLCSNLFQQKNSIEYMYIWCEYKNHYIIDDNIKIYSYSCLLKHT